MSKIVTLDNLRGVREKQKQISVLVGMLSPGAMINWQTQECLDGMLVNMAGHRLKDGRCKYRILKHTEKVTNIFLGRNKLCQEAIQNKCDYLLLVDSDMTFEPDSFENLLKHGKQITSALAFTKGFPYLPVVAKKTFKNEKYSTYDVIGNWVDNALIQVDGVGTAFLLIDLRVLEGLKRPYFFHEYFDDGTVLGSDYYFCAKAQNAGFEIWVDTSQKIGHIGEYNFGFEDYINHGGPVKTIPETSDPSTDYDTLVEYKVKWDREHGNTGGE